MWRARSLSIEAKECLRISPLTILFSSVSPPYRKIDERDVSFTAIPGHVGGFGAMVNRVGRGFPRAVSCGTNLTVVATYPYEGPDYETAKKLMEEAKIRDQEAMLNQRS